MSLYCMVCRYAIDEGLNQCYNCKTGFTSQLACGSCNRPVPRGSAECFNCRTDRTSPSDGAYSQPEIGGPSPLSPPASLATSLVHQPGVPSSSYTMIPLPSAPPVLPGLPAHVSALAPLPERYMAGKFGVSSEIRVNPGDISIMELMGQMVVLLHKLAQKMNGFQGHMESTRQVIRMCRALATELQDEIEVRRGPQG